MNVTWPQGHRTRAHQECSNRTDSSHIGSLGSQRRVPAGATVRYRIHVDADVDADTQQALDDLELLHRGGVPVR